MHRSEFSTVRRGNEENGKKVLIIAGEASGDLHGSHLVEEMLSLDPSLRFYGVGGEKMKKAGVTLVADIAEMAVVGITEVFFKIKNVYRVYRRLKNSLSTDSPSLIILIDYPDFNLLFARAAKKIDVPIVYYISPQIWAWRKRRLRLIARLIKKMIVIFPFEKKFYDDAHIDVDFVGHPLLDSVRPCWSREEAFQQFSLTPGVLTIGILPGSRMSEINRHLPPMLKALPLIAENLSPVQFIIPVAPGVAMRDIINMVGPHRVTIRVVENNIYDVMQTADLLLVASGTATVEAAIMGTPMIVIYRVSLLTYFLGRLLIKVKHIGMVNIIAGKMVAPELIQRDLNPEKIASTVTGMVQDPSTLNKTRRELAAVREKIGNPGASARAARIINDILQSNDLTG